MFQSKETNPSMAENLNNSLPNEPPWQQGELVELTIADVDDTGAGVGKYAGRAVFVPDTVTGDRCLVRLVRVKDRLGWGQLQEILAPSPHRVNPRCIVADKCGGCQVQHVTDEFQLAAKENLVRQALLRVGGMEDPPIARILTDGRVLNYRNKATYPLGISDTGKVKAGYYRRGTHRVVNLNRCPVQDDRLDIFLAEVKRDIQKQEWSVYRDGERQKSARVRHIGLRIGQHTGEVLLTIVTTEWELPGVEKLAQEWLERYPLLVGVCLNRQPRLNNTIFGAETKCLAGRDYLNERFGNLDFRLQSDTFFQVNTGAAELALATIAARIDLEIKKDLLIDAYCGIGTFTLPLAGMFQKAIGLESHEGAVNVARENALLNNITNVEFAPCQVEETLGNFLGDANVVILDPPRQGCDRRAIDALCQNPVDLIVYVSCKPSTLARDLQLLQTIGNYTIEKVQPIDFFPQTAHVETIAFLTKH
jgi:23S rRNA (uracil1939-C5)-methyltransferase